MKHPLIDTSTDESYRSVSSPLRRIESVGRLRMVSIVAVDN